MSETESGGNKTPRSSISFKAPHLKEFYSLVTNKDTTGKQLVEVESNNITSTSHHKHPLGSFRPGIARRPSNSTIDTNISMSPSILDLPKIISSKDRTEFETVLGSLLAASAKYSAALGMVSKAASEFGSSLEDLARLKGSETQSNHLMACSGLHYLISNHQQVLASSIEQNFRAPLTKVKKNFTKKVGENDQSFNNELKAKIKYLRQLEHVNYKILKSKKRNLLTYKDTLKKINYQIDSIDGLKYGYYDALTKLIEDANDTIIQNCSTVAKAEFEIYESIARKGWSGGGMDELLSNCPDPFGDEEYLEDLSDDEKTKQEKFHTKLGHKKIRKERLLNTKNILEEEESVAAKSPVVSSSIFELPTSEEVPLDQDVTETPTKPDDDEQEDNSFSLPEPDENSGLYSNGWHD